MLTTVVGLSLGTGCGKGDKEESTAATSDEAVESATSDAGESGHDAASHAKTGSDAKASGEHAKVAAAKARTKKLRRVDKAEGGSGKAARAKALALTQKPTPGVDGEPPPSGTSVVQPRPPRPLTAKERKIAGRAKESGRIAIVPSHKPEPAGAAGGKPAKPQKAAAPSPSDNAAVPKIAKGPSAKRPATPKVTKKNKTTPPLDTRRVLPLTAVREATDNSKLMPTGPVAGTAPSTSYNSTYFETPGQTDFGVAVQVWQEASRRDVNERFKQMKRQYPNASQTQALKPAKAFFAYFGQLQYLSFMVSSKRTIVTITCGEATCSHHMLFELAKAARSNL